MKFTLDSMVQRPFNFAIVDEVDSILVDEARTPLIISGPTEKSTALYYEIDKIIPKLIDSSQYIADNISSENALQQFENLRKYPSKYKREISDKIANIYVKLAENKIAEKNYIKADEYFQSAIKNNPSLKAKIKLKQKCFQFSPCLRQKDKKDKKFFYTNVC